ncbi:MAG: RnfABCDGE type electron transport complex subunit D [Prevotellaceae bacterium]|jgi:electron transport complex protein RnfD|nr:RnfABCDGE type electron transport complex subunit D [Prevotellaceae bacterium]
MNNTNHTPPAVPPAENGERRLLLISPAPHAHSSDTTHRLMRDVIIALLPAFAASVYFFGWDALRVAAVSIISCVALEWAIQKFLLRTPPQISDLSAVVTGLLLAMNLPGSAPWWLVVIGSIVAIGIAKMSFGGIGKNPFNPALVGRVFLLISFPVQMTHWTLPRGFAVTDAVTGATPLAVLKEGLSNGLTVEQIFDKADFTYLELLFGRIGGSAGEVSALALLAGFAWLLFRRVIRPHIPVTILATVAVFGGILWWANPGRFIDPLFHLLTGGVLLGAVFMATDYVTSPMHPKGMVIFGVGIGMLTMLIRVFGSYPEGISFAILIMNAAVPLINKYTKPKRYGKEVKHG